MMRKITGKYRYSTILLRQLVLTDFKLRYQNSYLGYLWSLLRPMAMFGVLYVVFTKFLRVGEGVPHYSVYLLLGIILWNFFIETTNNSVTSIVGKGELIRKLSFPRYIIILSVCFSALINLVLNGLVISVFMYFAKTDIQPSALFLVPILLAELFVFSLGMGFLLSALYVKYRDINYVWEVFVQAAFYATPILYPLNIIPVKAQSVLLINPMAQIIQDLRSLLITPETLHSASLFGVHTRIFSTLIVLFTVVLAFIYFKSRSKYFAEEV